LDPTAFIQRQILLWLFYYGFKWVSVPRNKKTVPRIKELL
jgi:hypothetical protein